MTVTRPPVILNFDDSSAQPNNTWQRIALQSWQEKIRFGCKWHDFKQLEAHLATQLPAPAQQGCALLGSGDYHHLSYLLLSRLKQDEPIHLVVCDNHPDNMRYPFGIHCGSWVYWASQLPHVARIDVLGISSNDIGLSHAWENHWSPLKKGKLHYWSVQQDASWLKHIGAKHAARNFAFPDALMAEFLDTLQTVNLPVYLSIDKDILSKDVVKTNWDQGQFLEQHLHTLIDACAGRLMGADITGDISLYQYKQWFKAFLSKLDAQEYMPEAQLDLWQNQQQSLNDRLIERMNTAWRE